MIRFSCPGCSATFTVGDEKAGKSGKCPKCQSQFVIPSADEAAGGVVSASANVPGGTEPPPLPADLPAADPPAPPPLPSSSSSAPPPPTDPNQPVEIQPCPKCNTRLTVLPADVGFDIQCPSCETVFKAMRADAPPPPSSGSRGKGNSSLVRLGSGSERRDDEDDRPSRRRDSRRDRDDDDDRDRPSRRRSRRDDDYDDDYDDDRPRRRRYSSSYVRPHRAGMVLTFGIVGLLMCWNIIGITFNILAIVFGSMDLKEMDNGTMDSSGRGQTSTGRTLGIVGLCLLPIAFCGFFALGAAGKIR